MSSLIGRLALRELNDTYRSQRWWLRWWVRRYRGYQPWRREWWTWWWVRAWGRPRSRCRRRTWQCRRRLPCFRTRGRSQCPCLQRKEPGWGRRTLIIINHTVKVNNFDGSSARDVLVALVGGFWPFELIYLQRIGLVVAISKMSMLFWLKPKKEFINW